MARSQIPFQVRDAAGNVRTGVNCTITVRSSGANASVWSAETGGTSTAGTTTTDANGWPQGWLDEGSYNIQVTGTPNYTRAFEISRGDGTALIADGAVNTNALAEASLVSADFGDTQITTAKYQDGGLATAAFATDSIDTRVLQDNAVTEPKIASGAISARVIAGGALTSQKFGNSSVGSGQIADNAVTAQKIADNAITTIKIADSAVTNTKLAAATVQGAKFATNVITLAHLDPNVLPIGFIVAWPTASTPSSNWLLCQGQAVSRTTYATLFANIGTAYGSGDGSTTFNLPDLRGRTPWPLNTSGSGVTARGLDDGYGAANLVQYRGPRHHHSFGTMGVTSDGSHAHFGFRPIWNGVLKSDINSGDNRFDGMQWIGTTSTPHGHSISGSVGELSAVRDYSPWLTLNFIIRVL